MIAGNGLELQDTSNLHLVTSHRTGALVDAARLVTNLGSVGVLIPLALIAGVFRWFKGARLLVAAAPIVSLGVAGFCALPNRPTGTAPWADCGSGSDN